jgi:hypothetical protein
MHEPPQGSPLERVTVGRAMEMYRASLLGRGPQLPAELANMIAMLPRVQELALIPQSLLEEADAISKAALAPSAPMCPVRSVRGEAAARGVTVESLLGSSVLQGNAAAAHGRDPAGASRARLVAAFRRCRPSRETEAWRQLAARLEERYGASIDDDELVLKVSPIAVLLERRTAAAQVAANALGEAAATFLDAVKEARQRIDTAVRLDPELLGFSPVALDFERGCEAVAGSVRAWWHQARRLGHEAAKIRDSLGRGRMSRALVACANAAHAWIGAHPPRRRGFWMDVVRLMAFHGWNERQLVGEHALEVGVSDLAMPGGTTRTVSVRLRQASHRLQELRRDAAGRQARKPETAPGA